MKKAIQYFIFWGCICYEPRIHAMQNILDYIQSHGKPALQKTVDSILLTPRSASYLFKHPHPFNLSLFDKIFLIGMQQFIAPGYFGHFLHEKESNFDIDYSMFIHAAKQGDIGFIKSHLAAGFPIGKTKGQLALAEAIKNRHYEIIKLLIRSGVKQTIFSDATLENEIEKAILNDESTDVIKGFLNAGANIDEINLHASVKKGNIPLVKLFLDAGADINKLYPFWVPGNRHVLAEPHIITAVKNYDPHMVQFLLDNNAQTDIKDNLGHDANYYTQIQSADNREVEAKKFTMQKLLRDHKKKYIHAAQEAIEITSQSPGYQGAKDIAGIIESYLE